MTLLYLLILTPLVAGLLSLLPRTAFVVGAVACSALLVEFVSGLIVSAEVVRNGSVAAGMLFALDPLGAVVALIVVTLGLGATLYSVGYLRAEVAKEIIGFRRVRQYYTLLHLFLLAMLVAIASTSPILMWIAIEATTLSTALLISFYNKPSSMEAAWKYLILNSVGLLLGFFGTLLFLYPAIHGNPQGLVTWGDVLSRAPALDPVVAKVAFVFVLTGYGTKVGFVPMHTWLPDAHSKAPAPISSLLSGVLLNVAFLAVLRFKAVADVALGPAFSKELLVFFGILSIVIAAFIIFSQGNYKTLLAYHSIEHMGIIALGFGFGGIAAFAGLLHMIYHSLAKSALFLASGNILLKYSSTKIHNIQGMLKTLPLTSALFIIGFLVMAGVPPSGIFITEFLILSKGISINPWVAGAALFSFVLVFAGIIKHVVPMILGDAQGLPRQGEASAWTTVPIVVLTGLLVIAGFFIPGWLQALLHASTARY